MKNNWRIGSAFLLAAVILCGCEYETPDNGSDPIFERLPKDPQTATLPQPETGSKKELKKSEDPLPKETDTNFNGDPLPPLEKEYPKEKRQNYPKAEGKVAKIGKNVFLEILPNKKRRVRVHAYVCRRRDFLEQFMCIRRTKEHEAVLAADIDARHMHAALIAAGAKAGAPVQFQPKYKPAHGTKIRVTLQYPDKDGKIKTVPAQQWIRHFRTKKPMKHHWVFAGSRLYPPQNKGEKPFYAANEGDVICISNFPTALLDVPVKLSNQNASLEFEAFTDNIPMLMTPVAVILEPVLAEEKK